MTLSTHVLDTSTGRPAGGLQVELATRDAAGTWQPVCAGETNADGRVPALRPPGASLSGGHFRLSFDVAAYFSRRGVETFYPAVTVEFLAHDEGHYHVPLLVSPYGYSTYRGS